MSDSGESATTHDRRLDEPAPRLTIALWAIAAIAALVPLAMTNFTGLGFRTAFTMDQFSAPKLLAFTWLLAIAAGAWAADSLRARSGWRVPRAWPFAAAFIVLALLSAVLSPHRVSAFFGSVIYRQGFITLALYALLVALCVQVVRRPAHMRVLAWATVAGGVAVAAYGLVQSAGLDPNRWAATTSPSWFERGPLKT